MRLFLAILPDEEFRNSLLEMQRDMKRHGIRGSYTPPENLHLTLAFLGEYQDPDGVMDALNTVPLSPFSIRLEGAGAFDRVFWAGVADSPELDACAARVRRALSVNRIPYDKTRFRAHITLVRQAREEKPGALSQVHVPRRSMYVQRISLMRSDRGKHGMIYTEIGALEV